MILVFAGNNSEANEVRQAYRLKPGRWAYISNVKKLAGLRYAIDVVIYYGTYAKRPDYEEIESALFHLDAQTMKLSPTLCRRMIEEHKIGGSK